MNPFITIFLEILSEEMNVFDDAGGADRLANNEFLISNCGL